MAARAQRLAEDADVQPQHGLRVLDVRDESRQFGLWLTSRQAMAFIGCPTLGATRQWFRRHGIIRRSNGTVSRLDLERELRRPRRHRMHPVSLANLRKRS